MDSQLILTSGKSEDALQLSQVIRTRIKDYRNLIPCRKIPILEKKRESLQKEGKNGCKKCRQLWRTLSYCGIGSRAQSRHPLTRPSPSSVQPSRGLTPPATRKLRPPHLLPIQAHFNSSPGSAASNTIPHATMYSHPGNYGLHAVGDLSGTFQSPPKRHCSGGKSRPPRRW